MCEEEEEERRVVIKRKKNHRHVFFSLTASLYWRREERTLTNLRETYLLQQNLLK